MRTIYAVSETWRRGIVILLLISSEAMLEMGILQAGSSSSQPSAKVDSVPLLLQMAFSFYVKSKLSFSYGNLAISGLDVIESLRILAKASKYLSVTESSSTLPEKLSSSLNASQIPKSISGLSYQLVQV